MRKVSLNISILTIIITGTVVYITGKLFAEVYQINNQISQIKKDVSETNQRLFDYMLDANNNFQEYTLENTDKVTRQSIRIQRLEAELEMLNSAVDAKQKRRSKIHQVAKAITDTLPSRHPFKQCRNKPTPGTINTIATSVVDMGTRYGVSTSLILGMIRRESAFCQRVTSRAGAKGLMQLMPATAESQQKEINMESGYAPKPWRIKDNIWLGVYYISKRLIDLEGNEDLALKAYNAGINHVRKVLSGEREDFYTEPKIYSKAVLKFKQEYQEMGLD